MSAPPEGANLELSDLAAVAHRVRHHIVDMAGQGGCFIGASLSCADLLVYLYSRYLRIGAESVDHPDRDVLLLSKGHDVPALYGTLAELGIIDGALLKTHLTVGSAVYWHPNRKVSGIEFHSGSLGHLPSVAVGMAFDRRLRDSDARVVVVAGDGELDEGSTWEAIIVAAAKGLGNLIFVIDRNGFQANVPTETLIPLEPLADKLTSFGCLVRTVDGHDFDSLEAVFSTIPLAPDQPTAVIAETVRGRGIPSIERRADRWFMAPTPAEVLELRAELEGRGQATLTSETLVVR